MSRYRPPRARSSPYITAAGYARLKTELRYLWKEKRPEVTRKVSEAAAMGDRSENAEYIYGKKQLREIDARVRFLSRRLEELKVVDRPPRERDKIFFGAWVTLADDGGTELRYRLVGSDEFDAAAEYISIDSPMARALVGRRLYDEIQLIQNQASRCYRVIEIDYEGATAEAGRTSTAKPHTDAS